MRWWHSNRQVERQITFQPIKDLESTWTWSGGNLVTKCSHSRPRVLTSASARTKWGIASAPQQHWRKSRGHRSVLWPLVHCLVYGVGGDSFRRAFTLSLMHSWDAPQVELVADERAHYSS